MNETLTSDLIREWRKASAECPSPISLDRMVIELADQVLHLRAQRDDLHDANNRLLEQRRAAQASATSAEAELEQITEDLRGMHAEFLERLNTGGQTGVCGWCGAPWPTPEAAREHAVGCEKNPAVQRAVAAEAEVDRLARAIHLFTENTDHVAGKANALSFALLKRAEAAEAELERLRRIVEVARKYGNPDPACTCIWNGTGDTAKPCPHRQLAAALEGVAP